MGAGFGEGEPIARLSTCLHPIVDRELGLTGLGVVMRNDFRRNVTDLRQIAMQRFGSSDVQRAALVALIRPRRLRLPGWRASACSSIARG